MLCILDHRYRLCDGISRREAMRIGGISAFGLTLPMLHSQTGWAARAIEPNSATAKSVILFWLSGGPPQHETWDPKISRGHVIDAIL